MLQRSASKEEADCLEGDMGKRNILSTSETVLYRKLMMIGGTEYSFVQTYAAGLHRGSQHKKTGSHGKSSLLYALLKEEHKGESFLFAAKTIAFLNRGVPVYPLFQRSFLRKRAKWLVFSSTTTSPTSGTAAHTASRTCSASCVASSTVM